ncbi:MAG: hypothetical protein HY698_17010, partial [Deltaproteobacteria bacterium]|nr:hypothetical protein [Deltaproteobacteria bacterium]
MPERITVNLFGESHVLTNVNTSRVYTRYYPIAGAQFLVAERLRGLSGSWNVRNGKGHTFVFSPDGVNRAYLSEIRDAVGNRIKLAYRVRDLELPIGVGQYSQEKPLEVSLERIEYSFFNPKNLDGNAAAQSEPGCPKHVIELKYQPAWGKYSISAAGAVLRGRSEILD